MRRLAILSAVLAAVLVAAPAASAKQVHSVVACGRDHHCISTRDAGVLRAVTQGGDAVVPTSPRARSVRVTAIVFHEGKEIARWTSAWVASQRRLVVEDGAWLTVSPRNARALARFTRGLKTFGPGHLHQLPPAGTGAYAGPPPPVAVAPVRTPIASAGIDWLLLIGAPGLAALAAAVLIAGRRRRLRPGPEAPAL
jgi:hypothetical protein